MTLSTVIQVISLSAFLSCGIGASVVQFIVRLKRNKNSDLRPYIILRGVFTIFALLFFLVVLLVDAYHREIPIRLEDIWSMISCTGFVGLISALVLLLKIKTSSSHQATQFKQNNSPKEDLDDN